MFVPSAGNRNVKLPALREEFSLLIAHVGTSNNINVFDASNVFQTALGINDVKQFYSGNSRWVWLSGNFAPSGGGGESTGLLDELRVVTVAGTQVLGPTEPGILINKPAPSQTPVTLPLSTARAGRPIRFADWSNTTSSLFPLIATPSGTERIMNLPEWRFEGLGFGGVMLFPNTTLGGYTIGG
jgi:hypothetical protein